MKIYTKTGDKGETSLLGGKRVGKDALRIETYGTVDELNSILGICRSLNPPDEIARVLDGLQHALFRLGADLASPADSSIRIDLEDVQRLERIIDEMEPKLKPLKNFILPGGSSAAAYLHFARTVCRRAERRAVRLSRAETVNNTAIIYLNRLSDLLFVLARWANALTSTDESIWNP